MEHRLNVSSNLGQDTHDHSKKNSQLTHFSLNLVNILPPKSRSWKKLIFFSKKIKKKRYALYFVCC